MNCKNEDNPISKCAVCVWCWEDPEHLMFCRLGMDSEKCEGPKEIINEQF